MYNDKVFTTKAQWKLYACMWSTWAAIDSYIYYMGVLVLWDGGYEYLRRSRDNQNLFDC